MTGAVVRLAEVTGEQEISEYGEGCVCRAVVVVRFSKREPEVHGYGELESMSQAYMDLHAGADQLMAMGHPERNA